VKSEGILTADPFWLYMIELKRRGGCRINPMFGMGSSETPRSVSEEGGTHFQSTHHTGEYSFRLLHLNKRCRKCLHVKYHSGSRHTKRGLYRMCPWKVEFFCLPSLDAVRSQPRWHKIRRSCAFGSLDWHMICLLLLFLINSRCVTVTNERTVGTIRLWRMKRAW
jgi:hypothetical protein